MGQLLDDIRAALKSPEFSKHPPEKQKEIRESYGFLIERDPDFALRMNDVDRERLRQEILTGETPLSFLEKWKLENAKKELTETGGMIGGIFKRRAEDLWRTQGEEMQAAVEGVKQGKILEPLGNVGMSALTASGFLTGGPIIEGAYESAGRGVGMKEEQSKTFGTIAGIIQQLMMAKAAGLGRLTEIKSPWLREALNLSTPSNLPAVRTPEKRMIRGLPATIQESVDPRLKIPDEIQRPFQDPLRFGDTPIEKAVGESAEDLVKSFMTPEMRAAGLTPGSGAKIVQIAQDVMLSEGKKLRQDVPITLQLRDTIISHPEKFREFVQQGVDIDQLADIMAGSKVLAGKELAQLSVAKRLFNSTIGSSPEAQQIAQRIREEHKLARIPPAMALAYDNLKHASNIWRGLLVTQLATAVRNFEVQGVRLGLDQLTNLTESAIQSAVGKAPNPAAIGLSKSFDESLELFRTLADKGKTKGLNRILDSFPDQKNTLFSLFAGDIDVRTGAAVSKGIVGKALDKADEATAFLNTINRAQEFFIRKVAFPSVLARHLRDRGIIDNLDQVATLDFTRVPKELVADAVNETLDLTFSKAPTSVVGKKFVELFSIPGLAQVIPFPRFMSNAMRFMFDFSPVGFMKLLSPAEQAKIAAGDFKTISKAIIGTGLLGTALAMRSNDQLSENTKFYELRMPDGTLLDTRPLAPLSTYLAFAELMLVGTGKVNRSISAPDVLNAALSTSFRFGSGLFVLDQVLDAVSGFLKPAVESRAPERLQQHINNYLGAIASGAVTPAQTVKDLLSDPRFIEIANQHFAPMGRPVDFPKATAEALEERKLRDIREQPFSGQILQRIPGASQQLPEKERPVGKSDAIREMGFQRQIMGMTKRTRTVAEAELERLGIADRQLLPPTGIPELDRKISKELRPLVESLVENLVTRSRYPELDSNLQSELILRAVQELRQPLLKKFQQEIPAAGIERQIRRQRQPMEEILREELKKRGVETPLQGR